MIVCASCQRPDAMVAADNSTPTRNAERPSRCAGPNPPQHPKKTKKNPPPQTPSSSCTPKLHRGQTVFVAKRCDFRK